MANYKNVRCPKCKKTVEAKIIDSDMFNHTYECPNSNSCGEKHVFVLKKPEVRVVSNIVTAVSIITGLGKLG